MSDVIAVDVGGTTIKAARVGPAGLTDVVRVPTPADGVLDAVVAVAVGLRDGATLAAGVVAPGTHDPGTGTVRFAANLGWRDVPLRAALTDALALPVAVGHDVAAAGEAEAAAGSAADLLFVALGTGVAAAHVVGGTARRGAAGAAGELGHLVVRPGGEACPCGQRGCLERYASGAALARHGGARALPEAAAALGAALASATALLDPAVIVLGGGLAAAGEALRGPVAKALAEALPWRAAPEVRLSRLGPDAGLLGAAELARRLVPR